MSNDKARTENIQRVYRAADYGELTKIYDEWAEDYDAELEGYSAPRIAAERIFAHLGGAGARVLDAGAGTGMVGRELARLGFNRITALDLSPGMLEVAGAKGVYEDLIVGELGKPLPFADGVFGAVTCIGTFTIGHAPPSALDELLRVLEPGGKIALSIRTDTYTEAGFDVKMNALEEAGLWSLVESTPPMPLSADEPDIRLVVWVYERS